MGEQSSSGTMQANENKNANGSQISRSVAQKFLDIELLMYILIEGSEKISRVIKR